MSVAGRLDAPFWNGLAGGVLHIQRCTVCARWHWPPQWRCGDCGSWDMDWPAVPMDGIVHTLSWTRHAFAPHTAAQIPYPVLLVELPAAGGARLLGRLDGPSAGLAIGIAVTGFVQETSGLPALRWRLAEDAAS